MKLNYKNILLNIMVLVPCSLLIAISGLAPIYGIIPGIICGLTLPILEAEDAE